MDNEIQSHVYMMTDMVEQMTDNEKFIPTVARFYSKVFTELKNSGFTEDQAMQILVKMKVAGN